MSERIGFGMAINTQSASAGNESAAGRIEASTVYGRGRPRKGAGVQTASVHRFPKAGTTSVAYVNSMGKRLFDIVVAAAIILVAAPVFISVFLLVALTSKGPAIFRQKRHGKDMVPFEILKFRTMYVDHKDNPDGFVTQASRGDRRVTKVGYWLRKSSLDELPQVWNVLTGDMSLIGPRPHALGHDLYYAKHIADYRRRYDCRPGITGLAQISGARGETGTHADMQRRVDYDTGYIATASFFGDIKIVLRTLSSVLFAKDVY